jgi:hypothetical protein
MTLVAEDQVTATQARGRSHRHQPTDELIARQLLRERQGTMNKHRIGALVAAGALTLTFAGTAFAAEDAWGGQGYPVNEDCEKSAAGEALWIWTGESTDTPVLHFDGNDYAGEQKGQGAWQFVTPYPTSEPTGTTLTYGAGSDGVLTLSHGCPAETTTTTTTDVVTTTDTTTTDVVTTTDTTTTDVVTTDTTTTDVVTTDTTTTDVVTTDTTTDVVTTDTTSEETTPEGAVEELTPPSTDTIGQPASSSSVSTGLLLVLAGILAAVLVVVPAAARNRR